MEYFDIISSHILMTAHSNNNAWKCSHVGQRRKHYVSMCNSLWNVEFASTCMWGTMAWVKYIDNQAFQIDFLRCCCNFETIDALLSMEFQIQCIHMVFILGESADGVRWMHGLFAQMLIVRTVQMEYFHLWRLHLHITYSRSVVGFHYCFHMIFDFNLNCGKWNEISIHLKIELFIRMHENQLFNLFNILLIHTQRKTQNELNSPEKCIDFNWILVKQTLNDSCNLNWFCENKIKHPLMRGASTHMENEQLCLHYVFGFTFVNHQLQSNCRFMHVCEITCNSVIRFHRMTNPNW